MSTKVFQIYPSGCEVAQEAVAGKDVPDSVAVQAYCFGNIEEVVQDDFRCWYMFGMQRHYSGDRTIFEFEKTEHKNSNGAYKLIKGKVAATIPPGLYRTLKETLVALTIYSKKHKEKEAPKELKNHCWML